MIKTRVLPETTKVAASAQSDYHALMLNRERIARVAQCKHYPKSTIAHSSICITLLFENE